MSLATLGKPFKNIAEFYAHSLEYQESFLKEKISVLVNIRDYSNLRNSYNNNNLFTYSLFKNK